MDPSSQLAVVPSGNVEVSGGYIIMNFIDENKYKIQFERKIEIQRDV